MLNHDAEGAKASTMNIGGGTFAVALLALLLMGLLVFVLMALFG